MIIIINVIQVIIVYPHKPCTWVLMAALSIITKTLKQQRFPSVGELINKPLCIQTMDYYSSLKRNELPSHKKTWRDLKWMHFQAATF